VAGAVAQVGALERAGDRGGARGIVAALTSDCPRHFEIIGKVDNGQERLGWYGTEIGYFWIGRNMPTLIFTPRYTEDSQALWKAAGNLGWNIERLSGWSVPDHLRAIPDPVLYGEALFGPSLAEQLGLALVSPPEDWLVRLPLEYKLRHITLTSLGQARLNAAPAFVKPPNDKSFPASVYRGAELPLEYADEMSVLVSDVVKWEKEFRCFVLNRSLRTYSLYSRYGELQRESEFLSTPEEDLAVEKFMATLLADSRVDLPCATVVDVGYIEGCGWACVEQNAAWGAGIYGCNPSSVLDVIQHASTKISGS
jgi:hypothetical protein